MFFLIGDEDFLILVCDGLWDVVKLGEVVDLVVQFVVEGGDKLFVVKFFVDFVKSRGFNDNILVVVVFFYFRKKDVFVKDIFDNFVGIILVDVEKYVFFDEKVINFFENSICENINFENIGEMLFVLFKFLINFLKS